MKDNRDMPTVKPLEWSERGLTFCASVPFGAVHVSFCEAGWVVDCHFQHSMPHQHFENPADALAATQAHYEALILSALED